MSIHPANQNEQASDWPPPPSGNIPSAPGPAKPKPTGIIALYMALIGTVIFWLPLLMEWYKLYFGPWMSNFYLVGAVIGLSSFILGMKALRSLPGRAAVVVCLISASAVTIVFYSYFASIL